MVKSVSLKEKFALIDEVWRPKVAAQLNGQDVRLVKAKGSFPWHSHADADEMFLCCSGQLNVHFRDRVVSLDPGEFVVVPRGIEHHTSSDGAEVLIFEPSEVVNTGDAPQSEFTAPVGVTI